MVDLNHSLCYKGHSYLAFTKDHREGDIQKKKGHMTLETCILMGESFKWSNKLAHILLDSSVFLLQIKTEGNYR